MLVLSRKSGQQIRIGDEITVTIVKSQGNTVRIGIEAPKEVRVVRAELPPLQTTANAAPPAASRPRRSNIEEEASRRLSPSEARKESKRPTLSRATRNEFVSGSQRPSSSEPAQEIEPNLTSPHPERWSVANMRARIQSNAPPRNSIPDKASLPLARNILHMQQR